eukprot:4565081-Alexandrium_andersonii.AAC.1
MNNSRQAVGPLQSTIARMLTRSGWGRCAAKARAGPPPRSKRATAWPWLPDAAPKVRYQTSAMRHS